MSEQQKQQTVMAHMIEAHYSRCSQCQKIVRAQTQAVVNLNKELEAIFKEERLEKVIVKQ